MPPLLPPGWQKQRKHCQQHCHQLCRRPPHHQMDRTGRQLPLHSLVVAVVVVSRRATRHCHLGPPPSTTVCSAGSRRSCWRNWPPPKNLPIAWMIHSMKIVVVVGSIFASLDSMSESCHCSMLLSCLVWPSMSVVGYKQTHRVVSKKKNTTIIRVPTYRCLERLLLDHVLQLGVDVKTRRTVLVQQGRQVLEFVVLSDRH